VVTLESFPAVVDLTLELHEREKIEPRIEFISGNSTLRLLDVEVTLLHWVFPWETVLFYTLVFTIPLFLLLLTIGSALRGEPTWKRYLASLLLVCGFLLIFSHSWASEDAFITLRHVENVLAGQGPVFNPGERVEGYTHATWFLILIFLRGLGLSPYAALIIPGLVFSLLALGLIFFKIRFPGQKDTGYLSFAAAALIGVSAFIDFGTSGLETGLSFFLLSLFAAAISRLYLDKRPLLLGLLLTLMLLTRPDFALFLVMTLLYATHKLIARRLPFSALLRLLFFPLLIGGVHQVFRMGYYAAIFPNPFFAKSGGGSYWSQGLRYLSDFSRGSLFPLILLLALLGLGLVLRRQRSQLSPRLFILVCGLSYGFFVIRGGGDFMHGRFLLPATLLITLSSAGAFDGFFEGSRLRRLTAVVLSIGLTGLSLLVVPLQKRGVRTFFAINNVSDERYFYYKDDRVDIREIFTDHYTLSWKTMGQNWRILSEGLHRPMRVAHQNIGFMGYYAGSKVLFLDRLGLTDPVVARTGMERRGRPGHEKRAPLGYLLLSRMTVAQTPFPLWGEVATTPYGELWDLSHGVLKSLGPQLPENFKTRLDERVTAYLRDLTEGELPKEADFLFFLRTVWLPYAPQEGRKLFQSRYSEALVAEHSEAYRWQQAKGEAVEALHRCIRSPLTLDRFGRNILYALSQSHRLLF
jgi:arabinofuranosyltransferase